MLSFIIPAHNEAAVLGATLLAIHQSAGALGIAYEVIVVDDASTDGTADVAREHGARVVSVELRQISAVRNRGAAEALGEWLVFVDADTLVGADVLGGAVAALRAGAIGGGCAIRFDDPVPRWTRIVMPASLWLGRKARLAAGCFFYCDAKALRAVGGFSERVYAGEEIFLSRELGRLGRFVVLSESVLTSGRKLRTYSGWYLLRLALRLVLAGRRGLTKREGLGLWYGPRRRDGSALDSPSE